MTQDEKWLRQWQNVMDFITANKRNPSKYDAEERGKYGNWLRHNRKLYNAGSLKEERMKLYRELMELADKYKRKNQYE